MTSLVPNVWTFLALTLIIGGAGAYVTGRAMALTWRGRWKAIAYMAPLAAAVRFLHYALFQEGTDPPQALVCFGLLCVYAAIGYGLARRRQMQAQYPWMAR